MDYQKLATQFIDDGDWKGVPVIGIRLFAKWLEEMQEAQKIKWCGCETYYPTREDGKCSNCGKNVF